MEQNAANHAEAIIHRSPIDVGPRIVLFLLTCAAIPWTMTHWPWSVQHINLDTLVGLDYVLPVPFLGLIALLLLAIIVHNLRNYRYILCDDYILEVQGRLSFSLHTIRLHYLHIRVIEIDKRFYQRFFNIGDLRVASAVSQGDAEIVMRGIYNPRKYKDMIQAKMNAKLSGTPHHLSEIE